MLSKAEFKKVKNGQRVESDYGVMCGSLKGRIYGRKESKWGFELRVKYDDFTFDFISGLKNQKHEGIGTYLI